MVKKLLVFANVLLMDSRVGQLVQLLHSQLGATVLCMHPDFADSRYSIPVTVFRRPYYQRYVWLRKLIKQENIGAVWVYNLPPLPHAIIGSLFNGANVVMNFAGGDIPCCEKQRWGYRHRWKVATAFKCLMPFPKRFICMSPFTRDLAQEAGIDPRKLVVIPNMFDIDRDFPPSTVQEVEALRTEFGIHNRRVIICVARHSLEKRIDQLIRAFALLRQRCSNLMLLLVGAGALLETHRELTRELGIRDDVRFIERIARQRVRTCYAMAEVSCNISDSDAFCNPVIESLTQGTPVVVGPNVGAGRYLDGVPFCRVERPEVTHGIAAAIGALIEQDVKHRYAIEAMAKAREFDVANVFPQWRALFAQMLQ